MSAIATSVDADAAERLVDQAEAQGHPRQITDPSVIGRTATLIGTTDKKAS